MNEGKKDKWNNNGKMTKLAMAVTMVSGLILAMFVSIVDDSYHVCCLENEIGLRCVLAYHLSWRSQNWHFCWIADTRIIYYPWKFYREKIFVAVKIVSMSSILRMFQRFFKYVCWNHRYCSCWWWGVRRKLKSSKKIWQTCTNSIKVTRLKILPYKIIVLKQISKSCPLLQSCYNQFILCDLLPYLIEQTYKMHYSPVNFDHLSKGVMATSLTWNKTNDWFLCVCKVEYLNILWMINYLNLMRGFQWQR